MVAISRLILKSLDQYSPTEWLAANNYSSAIARYKRELDTLDLDDLRRFRHTQWLRSAMATLFQSAGTDEIYLEWSDSADSIIREAWVQAGLERIPAGLIAMGKLGSRELNVSSDVDLIVLSDPSFITEANLGLRKFRKTLENASGGTLLRVDLDLRPGGRLGPVVTTINQLRDYYWSQGETWERLAWVRSRWLLGPNHMKQEIEDTARSYCYRRYLDFTVIEDLKLLRSRIHQTYSVPDHQIHLKLGPGGIRDLELFVHSMLIIHGGRNPQIRNSSTTHAIRNFVAHGLIPENDGRFLIDAYHQLRHAEHCVQLIEDRQTHILDKHHLPPWWQESRVREIELICEQVNRLVSTLLGPIQVLKNFLPDDPSQQIELLNKARVSQEVQEKVWPELMSAVARSGKSERDENARRQFMGIYLEEMSQKALDPDLAIHGLLDFVRSSRAKATLFTLLLREPRLIRDLVFLFSTSPYLGQSIASRPELLDSFLSQRTIVDEDSDWSQFLDQLVENRLLGETFAASHFFSNRNVEALGRELSSIADEITEHLLTRLSRELNVDGLSILRLGKWGGQELGIRSDLDFIVLTTHKVDESSQRVVRRLISRISENHRGGRLYAIDLRLRPSGHAGPLLISAAALIDYLRTSAPAWQRQAYLRARGSDDHVQQQIQSAIFARNLSGNDQTELAEIHRKLIVGPSGATFDLKLAPGGLLDFELKVQTALLHFRPTTFTTDTIGQIRALSQVDKNWDKQKSSLIRRYLRLREIEQLQQLTSYRSGSILDPQQNEFSRLAQILKLDVESLRQELATLLADTHQQLAGLDPKSPAT